MILWTRNWAESAVRRKNIKDVGKGGEHLVGKEEGEENPLACPCVCHSSTSDQDQEVKIFREKKTCPSAN